MNVTSPDGTQADKLALDPTLEQVSLARSESSVMRPGSVRLRTPALAADKDIELFSDRRDVLTLPGSITIPGGETTGAFDAAVGQVAERVVTVITVKHMDGDVAVWTPLLIDAAGDTAPPAPSTNGSIDHAPPSVAAPDAAAPACRSDRRATTLASSSGHLC